MRQYILEQLKEHGRELLRAQSQLQRMRAGGRNGGGGRGRAGGGGGATQGTGDLSRMVQAREQELRAVEAERDQLTGDLRAVRHRLADRDAELAQLQRSNHQHVDEAGRLRAMLEEWSSHSARLETRLEATQSELEAARAEAVGGLGGGDGKAHSQEPSTPPRDKKG